MQAQLGGVQDGDVGGLDVHPIGVTAGKYANKLHVGVLGDGTLHALGQIAVAHDTDSDHTNPRSFGSWGAVCPLEIKTADTRIGCMILQ